MRACKIVATLGPASDPPERLMMLIQAGVNCFRLNFSHGAHGEHAKRVAVIREAERRVGHPIGIIADLQGPKIRVGVLPEDGMALAWGSQVRLRCGEASDEDGLIALPHREIIESVETGDVLKLDDGKLQLTVTGRDGADVLARVDFGGVLKSRKGVNVPTRRIPISALTQKDRIDLAFALEQGVDFLALSFVQSADDVAEARELAAGRAGVIAKIEKPAALDDIDNIVMLSDAVMVARGDLGVELAPEQVPIAQRRIIRTARAGGKPVIVATHMLESMIDAPAPTRAEASDVATAVYQGADAVMLSAESAVGRHPQSAVAVMDRIIRAVEGDPDHWAGLVRETAIPEPTTADAISLSARHIASVLGAAAIVAYTDTGSTAQRVARERPHCPVLSLTPKTATARRLCLAWGVRPLITHEAVNLEAMVSQAESAVRALGVAGADDRIVVIAGIPPGRPGKTNTIRIARLD